MPEIAGDAAQVTFQSILGRFRRESFSEREKGARFERMMRDYLLTEPFYYKQLQHLSINSGCFRRAESAHVSRWERGHPVRTGSAGFQPAY